MTFALRACQSQAICGRLSPARDEGLGAGLLGSGLLGSGWAGLGVAGGVAGGVAAGV